MKRQKDPVLSRSGYELTAGEPTTAAAAALKGKKRAEKSGQIREALLQAAADVVGEVGYANASITLITQRAGVAQGTFYNYFGSRQEILDEIMPAVGRNMLAHIRKFVLEKGGQKYAELEEHSFRGFFAFLEIAPHFFRVLHEADIFAPTGFRQHIDNVFNHYIQFLERSKTNGEIPGYEARELEVVALILMAARDYLAVYYLYGKNGQERLPEWVIQAYMKFVRFGLEGMLQTEKARKPETKHKKSK
jgi:AcrR family transcriptional regulator